MAFKLLTNIEEEVTCPICLDLLKEPLSLDCGHSFCKACIAAENKESVTSQGGKSSNCPVCQMAFCSGELRPNWHVANIVERLQEVKVSSEEEQKRNLCERHEEKLLLFCKKDGRVICWVCERSQEHRGHQTVPMEEAVQEYQEKLQTALQKLREEQQEAKMLEATLREERTSWKNQMQNEKRGVQAQFKKLKTILENEELRMVQKLESEEKAILDTLAATEDELVQQSQLVRDLVSELEHRLQGSTVDMLQDVNHIMERSKNLSLKKQNMFLKEQRKVSRIPDLKVIIEAFREITRERAGGWTEGEREADSH
ncbi:E3 ubiquitin-protein ligase TRIM34-like isoform X1 [Halichoerus grypus]|uniref:tripartite motif-containing protein 34-like isoform X1 n=1 Tax=Halichoerus grypus TaxID=9711 RepID=UPI001659D3C3|nr:tripartite motif-containing protein 34-like isoform X1 [Halichoerus grypus]XP_035931900.1 tripartite motif-containing protein 34-like isoform X1 [Halichoerus grypus]XP_035931901.1 tripartite motif-containing protein 34-like isoform X1 [Halichoerus grypus]